VQRRISTLLFFFAAPAISSISSLIFTTAISPHYILPLAVLEITAAEAAARTALLTSPPHSTEQIIQLVRLKETIVHTIVAVPRTVPAVWPQAGVVADGLGHDAL
jgi:hypothetical protein